MPNFVDTFTRADNTDLGTDYTAVTGYNTLKIVGNAVRSATAATNTVERYSGISPVTAAQFVEVTVKTLTKLTGDVYLWGSVRTSSGAATCYNFVASTVSDRKSYIQKNVTSTRTDIAQEAATTWVTDDLLRGEIDGANSLTLYRNGTLLLTITDSTIPGPGQIGLGIYNPDAGLSNIEIETLSGGDTMVFVPRGAYQAMNRGATF